MIRSSIVVGGLAILMATTVGLMSTSVAQNAVRDREAATRPQGEAQNYETRRPNSQNSGPNAGERQEEQVVRASEIIGHNIVNSQDENVGEINDLVLDPMRGKVRYAAVTYGGFVGIGDKMFAVPWEAFNCRPDPENSGEYTVTLDVTQEQLEGAQGFDQENWPNFADPNFTQDLDKRYRVKRNRDNGVNVDVGRRGVDIDVDPRD